MQMIPLFGGPALGIPIGAIWPYAGADAPGGFLLCDGSAVSRNRYAALFAVIGTLYGAGDGETTFNVPDLRDRFPMGAGTINSVGDSVSSGLPNITGTWNTSWNQAVRGFHNLSASGAFYRVTDTGRPGRITAEDGNANNSSTNGYPCFDASGSNPIYGASNIVQPPAVAINYIICAEPIPVIKGEKGDPGPQYVFGAYPISGNPELGATWLSENGDSIPLTPEVGRIYLLLDSSTTYPANAMFRWTGAQYENINVSIWG